MQRSSKRVISLLVVSAILISFLSFVAPITKAQTSTKVTIMATSDEHGNIFPIDYYTLKTQDRGLAKVYTLVKQVRKDNPNSILISNGDVIQGTPLVYYYTKIEPDTTHPMAVVMNYMGYDAMVVGNHEIQDYGYDWLTKFKDDADFPILSANMVDKDTGEHSLTPFVIKEVGGIKVGILGLTTSETNTVTPAYNLKGNWFNDAVEEVDYWIPILRPQVDILIVSAHMGFEFGNDTKTFKTIVPVREGNVAYEIVKEHPEIDVMITGHDHYDIPPFLLNGVLCVQPGNWGQRLTKMDITLEKDGNHWKVVTKTGQNLVVDKSVEAAPEITDLAKKYNDTAVTYVDSVIGEAADTFDGTLCRLEDNPMLDLIHKVQIEETGANISIVAMLPGTPPVWPKGPIRVRDVYSLYIYDNTLWLKEVTGKQMKDAIEWSYRYYNQYDFGATDTPLVNPNIRSYNFDTVQGLEYVVDISKPIGQRVISMTYKGGPVYPKDTFKLAVNNYRGNGGGGYTMFAGAPTLSMSVDEIRNYMIEYIKEKKVIYPEVDNNWKMIPDYLQSPALGDIDTLVRRGVIKDFGTDGFMPDKTATRGDFAVFTAKSFPYQFIPWMGLSKYTFKDTTQGDLATPYIEALARQGIVKGYGDGTFRPDASITKETAATIFFRAMKIDQGSLSANFKKAVDLGLFKPLDNPKGTLTKAEVASFIVTVRFPTVTILHTNDFHGYLLGSTDATTKKPIGGSARIYTLVQKEEANNSRTFLVDAGDNLFGGPPICNFFYGKDSIEVNNAMGYDVATFGNHEFDYGKAVLKERMSEAKYQYVSANVIDTSTNSTFAPSAMAVKSVGLLNLDFVGVETTDLTTLVNPTGIEGLKVIDPVQAVNTITSNLDKTNYVVLLSHLGYDVDKVVANKFNNVDLIIGGHSHTVLTKPDVVNGIPIVQTGNYGNNLGKVFLEFEVSSKGAKLINMRYALLPVTDAAAEDPTIKAIIDPYNKQLQDKMKEVIGEALIDLNGERKDVRSKETNLGDYIADWMRAISGADIAITNGGGIRASIPKGPITVNSVYTALPFDNLLVKLELTGKQITAALENGFSKVETGEGRFPQISGVTVKVNLKNPAGSRIIEVLVGGKPIELDKVYTVVTNDFMAAGGDGYTAFKESKSSKWVTGNWMRDDLVDYIKQNPKVGITIDGRITFVSP